MLDHCTSLDTSSWRSKQSEIVEMGIRHLASSAKSKTKDDEMDAGRSFTKIRNKRGPLEEHQKGQVRHLKQTGLLIHTDVGL